jgi:hypothetical protein
VQLLRLQELLQAAVLKQGWSMEHLEASMHVLHAHSAQPLRSAAAAASTRDGAATGRSGAREAAQQSGRVLEGVQGKKGALDAADIRSKMRDRDASRGVPVLLLHVRGKLGMSVSFDLVSGTLCLHPGESDLPAQSFCSVRCLLALSTMVYTREIAFS